MKIIRMFWIVCFNVICILSFCLNGINAYAYAPVEAAVPVEGIKISDSNSHVYEIVMESLDISSPAPDSDRMLIRESDSGVFNIEITEPGTYVYKIYEIPGYEQNIIYDDSVYYATVYVVSAEDNNLVYSISVREENSEYKSDNVKFVNKYIATTTGTTSQISVTFTSQTSTTTFTSCVTRTSSDNKKSIIDFVDAVLTGDNIPIGMFIWMMIVSVIIALIAFLKRNKKMR